MGSAKKAVKAVVSAPVKVVSGIASGNVSKALNGAVNAATFGTMSINDRSGVVDVTKTVGDLTGANAMKDAADAQMAEAKSLIEEQKNAQEKATETANAARRAYHANDSRTIYTTALGDVAETAASNKRKRTLLGS